MIAKILLFASTLMIATSFLGIANVHAQVPEHCGYSFEHRCAVESEEEAQKILEVFPDAIVEVNEELYESIPEEDREDAEGIIDKGALQTSDSFSEEDDDNFQSIPPGSENLPPVEQSSAGLIQACMQSGFTEAQCRNMFISDDPGGFCSTLKLANVPCPKIQDPQFTFGDPEAAQQESNQRIRNIQNAINQCIAAGVCKPYLVAVSPCQHRPI